MYYERVNIGNGNSLDSEEDLLLSYAIEDGRGNILAAQHNCWIKKTDTFPGFRLGIQGMKKGETRKIFIHPAYGYGISSPLPPCTFLIASVTLHQGESYSHCPLSLLSPIDLSWLNDPQFYLEVEQSSVKLARSLGSMWGIWLSKSQDLNFSKLCQEIKYLANEQDFSFCQPSTEEQRLCNHVFWNLAVSE